MPHDLELQLLRQLVRSQIHALNNLLMTLSFATEAYVPKEQRDEFRSVTGDLSSTITDLRRAVATPGQSLSLQDILSSALNLASNVPSHPRHVQQLVDSDLPLNGLQAFDMTRLVLALLLSLQGECLRALSIDSEASLPECQSHEQALAMTFCYQIKDNQRPQWTDNWRLARQLARRLDADWQVQTLFGGQRIELTLRFIFGPHSTRPTPKKPLAPLKSQRVLLIDDDKTLRPLFDRILTKAGFESKIVHSEDDALRQLKDYSPELAIVDWQLGPKTSLELVKTLRQTWNIEVVVMSGDELDAEQRASLAALGVDHFLPKPLRLNALKSLFKNR